MEIRGFDFLDVEDEDEEAKQMELEIGGGGLVRDTVLKMEIRVLQVHSAIAVAIERIDNNLDNYLEKTLKRSRRLPPTSS